MKRALLMFSAVALLAFAVGCQSPCGGSCGRCEKGLLDYRGSCEDGNCGRAGRRAGRKGGSCQDGNCDGSCGGECGRAGRRAGRKGGSCADGNCDGSCGGACGKAGRRAGRNGGCADGNCNGSCGGLCGGGGPFAGMRARHGGGQEMAGPVGPPTPQVTYPYYTTRGPRDFLLDNPPPIGY